MAFQMLPRWFRIVFVTVMLLTCVTVASQVPHQAAMKREIVRLTGDLDILYQRIRKQEMEHAQALAALPAVQAELALVAPEAEAIYAREQTLRAQRKALRAEAKALTAELAALTDASAAFRREEGAHSPVTLLNQSLTEVQQVLTLLH